MSNAYFQDYADSKDAQTDPFQALVRRTGLEPKRTRADLRKELMQALKQGKAEVLAEAAEELG